jgi:hypothetical protein
MIYLDNVARPQMQADLVSYYKNQSISNATTLAQLAAPWADQSPANTPTVTTAVKTAP